MRPSASAPETFNLTDVAGTRRRELKVHVPAGKDALMRLSSLAPAAGAAVFAGMVVAAQAAPLPHLDGGSSHIVQIRDGKGGGGGGGGGGSGGFGGGGGFSGGRGGGTPFVGGGPGKGPSGFRAGPGGGTYSFNGGGRRQFSPGPDMRGRPRVEHGFRPDMHRRHVHKRFFRGGGWEPYWYYADCEWMRQRAIATGSPYWWRRYRECVSYYY
jgi:hypothetical protein